MNATISELEILEGPWEEGVQAVHVWSGAARCILQYRRQTGIASFRDAAAS